MQELHGVDPALLPFFVSNDGVTILVPILLSGAEVFIAVRFACDLQKVVFVA
mgnify:CR=1 FL=1